MRSRTPVRTTLAALCRPAAAALALCSLLLPACGGGGGGSFDSDALVNILTTSVPGGTTGVEYSANFDADFPHPPGKYAIVGGALPPGLVLDRDTGELSGYPRQVGNFSFTLAARDGVDPGLPPNRDRTYAEDRADFAMSILRGPPNILPQTMPPAQYRATYGYQIDVAGGTPPYVFQQTGGVLPNGLAVAPTGFVGSFPTQAQQDPYVFQVTVTDANGLQDTATLEVAVAVLPLIIATTSPLPSGAKNFAYSLQMELASAGGGQPYTWSQVAPTGGEVLLSSIGMEITADGILRNLAPNPGPTAEGTHSFTIRVTDEALQVATRTYQFTVNPGPVLTLINPNKAAKPGPYQATGSGFALGAQLIFKPGPTEVVITPTFQSSTLLTFANAPGAPAGAGGFVTVRVKNVDGGFFDLPTAFAFPALNLTFDPVPVYPSPQTDLSSTGLDVADVNKDGFADIVHCGTGNDGWGWAGVMGSKGGVDLMINKPTAGVFNGTFTKVSLDLGVEWHQAQFIDVDSDGDQDVVAIGRVGGQLRSRTWKNPYPSAWTVPGAATDSIMPYDSPWTIHASDMALGRLTNDNVPDLVYVTQNGYTTTYVSYSYWAHASGSVSSVQGSGTGAFSAAIATETMLIDTIAAGGVAVGALDGPGVDDTVVSEQAGGEGAWATGWGNYSSAAFALTSTASGIFGNFNPLVRANANGIVENLGAAIGDVSGDGNNDVLTSAGGNSWGGTAGIGAFQGSGFGTFSTVTPQTGASGAMYRYVTTFDGDFDVPLDVTATANNARIDIWKGRTGTSGLQFKQTVTVSQGGPNLGRVAAGDFNNDGREDICAAQSFLADAYYGHQTPNPRGLGSSQGVVIIINTSQ